MIIALPFFVETIDNYMVLNMQLSPLNIIGESVAIPIGLSIFHTTFNIINVLLMVGFIPLISSIVIKMQPSKGELDEEFHLEHIGTGLMSTTELSIVEANKEVVKFGERVQKLFSFMPALLEETNSKKIQDKLSRIKKYEDITDRMEVEIADYLAKASQGELSDSASIKVRSMISIINDMERIGDICYQMSIEISRKKEQNVNFLPEMKIQLDDMIGAVNDTLNIMQKNLKTNYSQVTIDKADRLEITVNTMRNKIRKNYLQRVEKGEVKIQAGMIYINLIHSLEKIGDHVFNITEAIIGE
jgi:phosphate:Na+ symporter